MTHPAVLPENLSAPLKNGDFGAIPNFLRGLPGYPNEMAPNDFRIFIEALFWVSFHNYVVKRGTQALIGMLKPLGLDPLLTAITTPGEEKFPLFMWTTWHDMQTTTIAIFDLLQEKQVGQDALTDLLLKRTFDKKSIEMMGPETREAIRDRLTGEMKKHLVSHPDFPTALLNEWSAENSAFLPSSTELDPSRPDRTRDGSVKSAAGPTPLP